MKKYLFITIITLIALKSYSQDLRFSVIVDPKFAWMKSDLNSVDNDSGLFLSAGGMFLLAASAFISWYFNKKDKTTGQLNFNLLAIKNTKRNQSRSLSTIVLLALGTSMK